MCPLLRFGRLSDENLSLTDEVWFPFIASIRWPIKVPKDILQPMIWLVKCHESGFVARILLARYASYTKKNSKIDFR